jgi:hypothetical protein
MASAPQARHHASITTWSPGAGKIAQYVAPPPPLPRAQARAAAELARARRTEEASESRQQIAALQKELQSVRAARFAEISAQLTYSPQHPRAEGAEDAARRRHGGTRRRQLGPVVVLAASSKDAAFFDVNTPPEKVGCTECGREIGVRLLVNHQRTECRGRFVACKQTGCAARFREADRTHHEKHKCKAVKARLRILKAAESRDKYTECPLGCGAGVTKKDLPRHTLSVCPLRMVTCPHMGCAVRLVAGEMLGPEGHGAVGCNINAARERMAKSSNDRRLVPVACSPHHNMGCGKMILPKNMKRHEEIECPNRLVECGNRGCKEKVAFNILKFHEDNLCKALEAEEARLSAGRLEYACDLGCGEYVFMNQMADHKRNQCVNRETMCSTTGCGKKMPFYLIEKHEQIWDRRVEQASQKFYYVNPDTEETTWEDPGCRILRKREEYLEMYESKPRKVLCKLGCRTVINNQIDAYRQHLEACPNQAIPCPSPGHRCDRNVLRRNLAEHMNTECKVGKRLLKLAKRGMAQRFLLECTHCGVEVIAREYTKHRNRECPSRSVACKYWDCTLFLPADRWMQHVNGECQHSAKWRDAIVAARKRPSKKPPLPAVFRGGAGTAVEEEDEEDGDGGETVT